MDNFKLVTVLPVNRGIFTQELTYFTAKKARIGDLISVPIRSKDLPALVISVEDAQRGKAGVRKMPVALKKAGEIRSANFLDAGFIQATRDASDYFVTTPGQLMSYFIPKVILGRND